MSRTKIRAFILLSQIRLALLGKKKSGMTSEGFHTFETDKKV
jgi:hypothetical protein